MDKVVEWLLEGDPYVRYRTYADLLERKDTEARHAMLAHPKVSDLVAGLANWPCQVLNSHKSAGHPIYRPTFLADLGLRKGDPGMDAITERIMEHQSPKGLGDWEFGQKKQPSRLVTLLVRRALDRVRI